jgi:hypothetical protein
MQAASARRTVNVGFCKDMVSSAIWAPNVQVYVANQNNCFQKAMQHTTQPHGSRIDASKSVPLHALPCLALRPAGGGLTAQPARHPLDGMVRHLRRRESQPLLE